MLTGKGLSYGGSLIRPEATGFGAVYYANEVFAHEGDTIKGKTFALSGFGNVTWGVARKLEELGAVAITLSGPDGYVYDPKGVTGKKVEYLLEMRASGRDKVKDYADRYGCAFYPGEKPWGVKADVVHALRDAERCEYAERKENSGLQLEVLHRGREHADDERRAELPIRAEAPDCCTQQGR